MSQARATGAQPLTTPAIAATLARRDTRLWALIRPQKDLIVGTVIVALAVLAAIAAPLLAREEIDSVNITARLQGPFWLPDGRAGSLLGTDQLGRDVFTRLFYGARISLTVAFVSVVCATLI